MRLETSPTTTNGIGMSRAAKKRARKKQQQQVGEEASGDIFDIPTMAATEEVRRTSNTTNPASTVGSKSKDNKKRMRINMEEDGNHRSIKEKSSKQDDDDITSKELDTARNKVRTQMEPSKLVRTQMEPSKLSKKQKDRCSKNNVDDENENDDDEWWDHNVDQHHEDDDQHSRQLARLPVEQEKQDVILNQFQTIQSLLDRHFDNDETSNSSSHQSASNATMEYVRSCKSLLQLLPQGKEGSTKGVKEHTDGPIGSTTSSKTISNPTGERTIRQQARDVFQFLLQPMELTVDEFYQEYWEKKPLYISCPVNERQQRFHGLLSKRIIQDLFQQHVYYYGRDINVTKYQMDPKTNIRKRFNYDKVKQDVTTATSASTTDEINESLEDQYVSIIPDDVWKLHEQDGCTIRLLCPQQHVSWIHQFLSLLEVEWGCMVGSNAYLTPSGIGKGQTKQNESVGGGGVQGFAPHYDDIEAFVLQLQGRKRWQVFAPIDPTNQLPRYSSRDYTAQEIHQNKPVIDIELQPGDVLYMPRGWIHQAYTSGDDYIDDEPSLHLTVSAMQQWAWVDLMELLLPQALESTAQTSVQLRQGLPPAFLDYMGCMHDIRDENIPSILKQAAAWTDEQKGHDKVCYQKLQNEFRKQAKLRIRQVADTAVQLVDAACDQLGKRLLSDRLPPAWTVAEETTIAPGPLSTNAKTPSVHIDANSLVRLARPGIARLVLEDDGAKAVVYHCVDNSRVYQEYPVSPLEFELDDAPAIEQLLTTVEPHWICVDDLIHDTVEDKVGVAQALYDERLLSIRQSNTDKTT